VSHSNNERDQETIYFDMNLYTNASTGNITNFALETRERKIILMLKFLKFHFVSTGA
jgi:hypothetical protein